MKLGRAILFLPFVLALASCVSLLGTYEVDPALGLDASFPDASASPDAPPTTADGTTPPVDSAPDVPLVVDGSPDVAVEGCTELSCADGCCAGKTCVRPTTLAFCGVKGAVCSACDSTSSDACGALGCQCGTTAACGAGQRCVGGACVCDSSSCANGCCQGTNCVASPSLQLCGGGGAACVACDAAKADKCTKDGCRCGAGAACGPSQRCTGGVCVCEGAACSCDATRCPTGCCQGNLCVTAPTLAECGKGGGACVACSPTAANLCTAGSCQCGTNAPCGAGQICSGGQCVCNAQTCPNGCCQGNACVTSPSLSACGSGGTVCKSCSTTSADTCTAQGCRCGSTAECGAGQKCSLGRCVCDATTCAGGCCAGTTCVSPRTAAQCAPAGMACQTCDSTFADGCSGSGVCTCGMSLSCGKGQRCLNGRCTCDGTTCDGCCQNDMCLASDFETCGSSGRACVACVKGRADGCGRTGNCECGASPQCDFGGGCCSGTCVDLQSDPNNCGGCGKTCLARRCSRGNCF